MLLWGIVFSFIVGLTGSGLAQTSFSTADLEGTWYGYGTQIVPNVGVFWGYGTYTFDSAGNVTSGSYTMPDGTTIAVTEGSVALDENGIVSGSFITETGDTLTFQHGKMDHGKTLGALVATDSAGGLAIISNTKAGGSFATSDFEGTWYVYATQIDPSLGVFWGYGTYTFDSAGNVTSGSFTLPDGTTIAVTEGSVGLDENGIGTGSLTYETGDTRTIQYAKMDQGKTCAFVETIDPTTGSLGVGYCMKAGGTFVPSDLEGTWYIYDIEVDPTLPGVYWIYGAVTVDDEGNITGGTYTAPDGTTINVTGGQFSLDADGIITATVTAEGGLTGTFPSGKLDQSKTIASFVGIDSNNALSTGIGIKLAPEPEPEPTGDGGGGGGTCFIATTDH